MVPGVVASFDQEGNLKLNTLLDGLKEEGFNVFDSMIFYFSNEAKMFTYCGKFPFSSNITIPASDIAVDQFEKVIELKVRKCESKPEQRPVLSQQTSSFNKVAEELFSHCSDTETESQKCIRSLDNLNVATSPSVSSKKQISIAPRRRHAERKVGEVMAILDQWRKYYDGVYDPKTNTYIKTSLAEAAKRMGIPRKSLDDYMLVVKQAKAIGFDFGKNGSEKFGVVRSFVKKFKGNMPKNVNNEEDTLSDNGN